jgi:hypothetical protein
LQALDSLGFEDLGHGTVQLADRLSRGAIGRDTEGIGRLGLEQQRDLFEGLGQLAIRRAASNRV